MFHLFMKDLTGTSEKIKRSIRKKESDRHCDLIQYSILSSNR